MLSRWDQGVGKIPELSVYGPPNTDQMTQLLFGETGVFGPDLAGRTEHPGSHFIYEKRGGVLPRERPHPTVTEVADGTVVECADWCITVAEVVHCQPQLTCLAYRLEAQGHSIVFGGDTGPTAKLTELAAGGGCAGAHVSLHQWGCHRSQIDKLLFRTSGRSADSA